MPELRTRSADHPAPQPGCGANLDPAIHSPRQGPPKARILVVENDTFVRGGVIRLLNGQTDLACCGEAGSIAATPLAVATQKPNLVLLDLRLEDGEAFELIASLSRQFPDVPILVLSQHDEKFYAERVMQAGARGYVMKEAATEHLLSALRTVLDGNIYLSPAMTLRVLQKS